MNTLLPLVTGAEVTFWVAGPIAVLGALGLAKQARADFEQAIKLDPTALDGSAYTSLGVLYYSVPGWPVDEFFAGAMKPAE